MVTIESISIVFTGLSVSLAAFYYISSLRNAQRTQEHALETRQAQLYMQLYSFYDNKEFLKDYGNIGEVYQCKGIEDWQKRLSASADIDAYSSWLRVGRFLDGVGILLKRNLIDSDLIFELLGDVIRGSWDAMAVWLKEAREYWDRPQLWRNFEYLYNEYMSYIEEHPEFH